MSVRWQHCIDHADKYLKAAESPDCLLGVVPQPTDSLLSETSMSSEIRCRMKMPDSTGESVAGANPLVVYCCHVGLADAEGERQGQADRETGQQGEREREREGGREAGRQGGREAGRQGGREAGRQGGREGGRERESVCVCACVRVRECKFVCMRTCACSRFG